ncbi:MAG: ABC transporter permease [Acidimicrobiales bacterium]
MTAVDPAISAPRAARHVPTGGLGRTIRLGILSGRLEVRGFFRNTTAVVFGLAFPVVLMVLFATIFNDTIQGTGGVTIAQYMTPGIIAIEVATAAFSNLGISSATERSEGRIKRLAGTPLPVASYFIGKVIETLVTAVLGVGILLAIAVAFYGLEVPSDPRRWVMFAATFMLGLAGFALLGIAMGTVPSNGRTAPGIITPPFLVLQFISGTFLQFNTQPGWLQAVANLFPLRWMALGMRSVFLPDPFVAEETGRSWQRPTVLLILLAWTVGGALLARWRFTWRESD